MVRTWGLLGAGCIFVACATGTRNEGGGGSGGEAAGASTASSSSSGGTTATSSSSSSSSSSTSSSSSSSTGGPGCGDGTCDPGETCTTCPSDCGLCCGDGQCTGGETCDTCPLDCGPVCCAAASPGNPNGPSIYVYSNYDGGQFSVSVDVNVPNLVLAFVSYEAMNVTITGPYVGNVVGVRYAGYNDIPGSTFTGVPANLVTIDALPPSTLADPNGSAFIDCCYQGGCGDQGGCSTAAQVEDYFVQTVAGNLASFSCQYNAYVGTLSTANIASCN